MEIRILGSAAGGGVPQWNCNCDNCAQARRGSPKVIPRTQSSIAVRGKGPGWILINASPDLRQQLNDFPGLRSESAPREIAIAGIVLVDSQIDHTTGLLLMRESTKPLALYCTERVHRDLTTGFPVINLLQHYCGVEWHPIPTDGSGFQVAPLLDLNFTAIPLRSKAPPYSPHRDSPAAGDNVGLLIEESTNRRRLFYAPGLGQFESQIETVMETSHCLLVDGTTWSDDELARCRAGTKRASEMGHLSQSGPGGMVERLRPFDARKILIHINNTNPILNDSSVEHALLSREGIEVAHDGMQFTL